MSRAPIPVALLSAAVAMVLSTAIAAAETAAAKIDADQCESRYAELQRQHSGNLAEIRDAWRAERGRCEGTGIFELLLARDERKSGDEATGIAILEDMVRRDLPYHEQAFVLLKAAEAKRALQAQPPDVARYRALRDELIAFGDRNQTLSSAREQAAEQSIRLRDYDVALAQAKKAVAIDPESLVGRRVIVLTLHEAKRCPEAEVEYTAAVAANKLSSADLATALAAADCFCETGDPASARGALDALVAGNPATRDDARIAQLQRCGSTKQSTNAPTR